MPGTEPVAFAGHVRRQGERGLLVLTGRELVFAAETGRVDRTPLERLQVATPRDTILTVAPGEGGRLQDDFRPLTPASFAGVDWPEAIRAEVLAGAPGALEIGDRRRAIRKAVGMLRAGDVLVIAGKGHEQGQTVGAETLPFDDVREAEAALREPAHV